MELNELENGHSSSARMSVRLDNPEAPSSSPPPSPSTPLRMMTPSKLPSSLPSTPPAVSVSATAAASASPAPSSAEASARAWRSGKFSKSSKWSGLSVLGGSSAALLSSAGSAVNLFRGTSNKNLEPPKLEDVLSDSHRDGRLTKDSLRSFLESEYCEETVDFLMAVDDYRKAYESAISVAKIGEHAADSTDAQIVSWDGGGGEEAPRESQRTYSNPMHEQNDAVARSFAAHAADGTATGTTKGDVGAGTVVGATTAT
eukprot:CAMPEP_0119530444 /NCGR_PEP_ID=MMETSP1344-20130328/44291_1 /TAXON_ID=236787 /ORGANISM="Florenciella parvula, Strain CCMP2471" /LENGTH=257 /DNA_ID=CAMNT_0007570387 /DNA_START=246 /DNA_END=1015 /DNA_ORIENTATION=-